MRLPLTMAVAAMYYLTPGPTLAPPALADEPVSFKGKTVTMITPTTAGANTDLSARLFAKFYSKYLPGQPTTISQNIPAGHGITARNYLTQQAKTDGTTLSLSSSSQVDPITYRAAAGEIRSGQLRNHWRRRRRRYGDNHPHRRAVATLGYAPLTISASGLHFRHVAGKPLPFLFSIPVIRGTERRVKIVSNTHGRCAFRAPPAFLDRD